MKQLISPKDILILPEKHLDADMGCYVNPIMFLHFQGVLGL